MRISVFGLGFVGCVTSVCLASRGHDVIGVDVDLEKIAKIRSGKTPVVEPRLEDLLLRSRQAGRINATADTQAAVDASDVSLVCVNVPTRPDGSQDLAQLEAALLSIGEAIARKRLFHSVVIRSTVLPGTTRDWAEPLLERASGGRIGESFGLAHHPEFMREGSGVNDFTSASRNVVGELDRQTADILVTLFGEFSDAAFRVSPELSELAKYTDNVWHATKVAFANEIGAICSARSIDSLDLMNVFMADSRLNISEAYLRPGFGYGGPCLSKDTNALLNWASDDGLELPLLVHVEKSNQRHHRRAADWMLANGRQRFAILGLSYKLATNDVRGSLSLDLAEALRSAGREVRAFDQNIRFDGEVSQQPEQLRHSSLLAHDLAELIAWSDTIVICANAPEFSEIEGMVTDRHVVLDFARLLPATAGRYNIRSFV